MADDPLQKDYILYNENELTRLAYQHRVIKDAMNNRLVWAPMNLTASPLKILDLCTADGMCIFPGLVTDATMLRRDRTLGPGTPVRAGSPRHAAYVRGDGH
jgi:hypothetical protein